MGLARRLPPGQSGLPPAAGPKQWYKTAGEPVDPAACSLLGPVRLRMAGPRGCTLGPIPGLYPAPLLPVSPGLAVLRLRGVLPPATEGPVLTGGRQGLRVQGTQVLLEAAETWPGPVGPVLVASGSWRAGATWGRAPSQGQSPWPSPLPWGGRGWRHLGPWELIPGNMLPL